MNDFTKEELIELLALIMDRRESIEDFLLLNPLGLKIQGMIDNYPSLNSKWIAKAHLKEAISLINHATGLLGIGLKGLENDNK